MASSTEVTDVTERMLHYKDFEDQYREDLVKNWDKIITKNLKYRNPGIVNLEVNDLKIENAVKEGLFVLPVFV